MKFSGSQWQGVGVLPLTGKSTFYAIAIKAGTPYVAFSDNANTGELRVVKFE